MKRNLVGKIFGIALVFVMLAAMLGGSPVLVREAEASPGIIYVPDDYTKIQWAVDNATPGDTIIVYPGTYIENVDVNKDHLTIRSENGAGSTIVQATTSNDDVFRVTATWVNITGFTMQNATGSGFAGIYLYYADHCNISSNNVTNNNNDGIKLDYSSNNTLTNNTASSNGYAGIYLSSSSGNTLSNNTATNNYYGIGLYSSSNSNTLTNNTASSNNYGILLYPSSNNNTLMNNTASSNDYDGIWLDSSSNNTLTNNTAWNNTYYGIYLYFSSNNTLTNNTANSNPYCGIYMGSSSNNTLTNNTCSNNSADGISLYSSSNNTLTNNTASSNEDGISLYSSSNNTLTNNTANSNTYYGGIYLYSSSNNNLTNNTANSNNNGGILLVYSSNNNMLINNTANSNTYDGILLQSSSNNTLTNNTANGNYWYGIWLYSSSNNTLTNNTASSNNYGIYLYPSSNNNTLTNNTASSNYDFGIYLSSSSGNTLSNNTATNNYYGIGLYSSSNNNLTNNTANSNSQRGIYLSSSSNNNIYNNYFANTNNAWDNGINTWNTTNTTGPNIVGGPYLGGNYWSDYSGSDTNGDGFGETQLPYNCTGNITNGGDYLPLIMELAIYNLTISSSSGGNVTTPGEGEFGPYGYGTVVGLDATADASYTFVNWTGDVDTIGNVDAASTTITMNGNYSIVANFAINRYDLTISSTSGGNVTTPVQANGGITLSPTEGCVGDKLTVNGEGFVSDKTVSVYYDDGLQAKADVEWGNKCPHGFFTVSFTIPEGCQGYHDVYAEGTSGRSATARFKVNPGITLDTSSGHAGDNVTAPGMGVFTYDAGTVVDLVATADSGYQFVNWTGDVGTIGDVDAASTNITMNGNYTITANFAVAQGWGFEIQPDVTKVVFNRDFTVNAVVTHYTGDSDTWQMMLRFDPTLLEVTSVVQPTTLPNGQSPDPYPGEPSWNNTAGWVYTGYGIPPMTPYVNETFVFSTIHFHSYGVNGTSPLNFTYENPYYSTQIILVGSDYLNRAKVVNGTVEVVPGATLQGNVTFVGRGTPPDNKWIENFVVRFFQGGSEMAWSPINATTNNTGVFTIEGIDPGTYDIGIKNWTSLSELVTNVTLTAGNTTVVNFGTMREGDADNNDIITGADRSILYTGWGSQAPNPGYNAHADFNRDGWLTGADRSVMYAYWGQHGDLV